MSARRNTLLLLLLLTPYAPAAAPPPAADRVLDDAVRRALKSWSVPGAAVVVVRDGRTVYCKGQGTCRAGVDEPVTPDTLFPLSSCSKAFTTAAMAQLAAEGKLSWGDRVREHLPWFRLSDPLVEAEVRLRDLACHRTGLGSHELLWHHAPWTPEDAVRRLRFLPLERPFRTTVVYQSTAFTAAGLAAAAAADCSWTELIRSRLLVPLGMSATCLSDPDADRAASRAWPHRLDRGGEPREVPWYRGAHPDPAISIHSTARDLGRWLRFQLEDTVAARTHVPQIPIRLSAAQKTVFPDTAQVSYALGWVVHDHAGVKLVSHGGAIDGFRVHIVLAPRERLGIAILCNLQGTFMPLALGATLVEELLDLPRRDWHVLYQRFHDRLGRDAQEQRRRRLARRQHGTTPSCPPHACVGDYEHAAYGTVRIAVRRGRLVWRWRDEEVPLEHFHHDTYHLHSDLVEQADVIFSLDENGAVAGLHVTGQLGVSFRRVPIPRKPR